MSLLAPLYLAGLAALSLPLLFHLIRRTPRGRVPFSSLMFLRATPPRLVRRSRLDNIALLCLRALILLLLAGAFARPFLRTDATADPVGEQPRVAILLDTSASMRRPGLWEDARREVERELDEQPAEAEVTLFAFDRGLRRLVPEGDGRAAVRAAVAALEPGWAATDLGNALVDLADELHARAEGEARILLVSDLQEGSARGALEERDWPGGVRVELRPVRARGGNASLHPLAQRDTARAGAAIDPWVRVANDADASVEELRLRWSDGAALADAKTVFCPAGESRVVQAPARPAGGSFDRLVLEGDDAPFDDVLYDRVQPPREYEVLSFAGEELDEYLAFVFADGPLTLTRAPTWPAAGVRVEATPLVVATLDEEPAPVDALVEHARQGGVALAVLAGPARGDAQQAALRALLDEPELMLAEAEVERGYALLGEVELEHPLLAPFDDPRFSDFTKIRFWHRRAIGLLESSLLRVLARFDDGAPFLLERVVGEGRVLVMASSWQPDDSDLGRSTKFAPLLHGMLRLGRRPDPALAHIHVGDAVPLPRAEPGEERVLIKPDGERIVLDPDAQTFAATDLPGFYELRSGERESAFTVRLDPAESRTDPLEGDPLALAGVTVVTPGARAAQEEAARQRSAAELEQGQQGWRWLILAALALLMLETVWAGRLARRTRAPATAS